MIAFDLIQYCRRVLAISNPACQRFTHIRNQRPFGLCETPHVRECTEGTYLSSCCFQLAMLLLKVLQDELSSCRGTSLHEHTKHCMAFNRLGLSPVLIRVTSWIVDASYLWIDRMGSPREQPCTSEPFLALPEWRSLGYMTAGHLLPCTR